MSNEAIVFYARKFFPHLQPIHGQACVRAILENQPKTLPGRGAQMDNAAAMNALSRSRD